MSGIVRVGWVSGRITLGLLLVISTVVVVVGLAALRKANAQASSRSDTPQARTTIPFDVNSDGVADLLLTEPIDYTNPTGPGRVHVVTGGVYQVLLTLESPTTQDLFGITAIWYHCNLRWRCFR